MPSCVAFLLKLDQICWGKSLTGYVHQKTFMQLWQIPQTVSNYTHFERRESWVPPSGGNWILSSNGQFPQGTLTAPYCCFFWGISLVWLSLPLAGRTFLQDQTPLQKLTSLASSFSGTEFSVMLLMLQLMIQLLVCTGTTSKIPFCVLEGPAMRKS